MRRKRWELHVFGFWLLDYQWTLLDNNRVGVCAFWALPFLFSLLHKSSCGDIILKDVIFLMLHHHCLLFLGNGCVSPTANLIRLRCWSDCLHLIIPLRSSRATLELSILRDSFLIILATSETVGWSRDCRVAHFYGMCVAI